MKRVVVAGAVSLAAAVAGMTPSHELPLRLTSYDGPCAMHYLKYHGWVKVQRVYCVIEIPQEKSPSRVYTLPNLR